MLVDESAPVGRVTNSASVTSPTEDRDQSNNADTAVVVIVRATDVSITKTHTGQATVGEPLTFQLDVHNNGPSDAGALVVTDTLPPGTRYVSAEGTGWTCTDAGAVVTCALTDPLPVGADAPTIDLVVDVLPGAYPEITNTAVVDAGPPDLRPSDNTDTDTVEVPALVNLTLTKRHVGALEVGGRGRYAIAVRNEGPTPDPGPMTVTDRLPVGLSYVSGTGPGWTCSASGRLVRCRHSGLGVGKRSLLSLVVDVGPAAYPSVLNVAAVRTPSAETDIADNVDDDLTTVTPLVHLALRKDLVSHTEDRAVFDLTTTNRGPNDTTEPVVLVDDLPDGLGYVSAGGPGWTCASVSDTVTCTHPGSIAVDDSSTVRLVSDVDAPAGSRIRNVATVSGGGDRASHSDFAVLALPRSPVPGGSGSGGTSTGPGAVGLPDTGGAGPLDPAPGTGPAARRERDRAHRSSPAVLSRPGSDEHGGQRLTPAAG